MSVWLDKPRRLSDGRHKASGRTTVWSTFQNFAEILSWFEPRPDGVALSSGRSYFSCTQFTYQGFGRPDQGNGRPDGWLDARNFHISSSRVRTSGFWMRYLPYGWARPDGNPHRPDGCNDLLISVFWKEISWLVEHWVSSGRAAETSGRMIAGAIRSFSTQRKVRTKTSRCPNG